jgi:hypothetical protein
MTALKTARLQNVAAILGGHSFHEAMDALMASHLWLVGPFHYRNSLLERIPQWDRQQVIIAQQYSNHKNLN